MTEYVDELRKVAVDMRRSIAPRLANLRAIPSCMQR
jgi:hypothetical protein